MKQLKALIFLVGLVFSSVVSSTEVMVENLALLSAHFHPRVYNALPEVEDASQALKENGNLEIFLQEARDVAIRNEIESFVGVRLIHRHFAVEDDERMVESLAVEETGKAALITQPERKLDAVPASWIRVGDSWEAFEYSRDKKVRNIVESTPKLERAAAEINALAEKHGLTRLLAVSILAREWTSSLPDNVMFLEESYLNPTKRSVVTVENVIEGMLEGTIVTAWELSKPITHGCVSKFVCNTNVSGKHYERRLVHERS